MDRAALIGLDWGTSSARAYLLDAAGAVLDSRVTSQGVLELTKDDYPDALTRLIAGWPVVPLIACGMVGSNVGWFDVPYLDCPATPDDLAAALVRRSTPCGILHVVPGLRHGGSLPGVMRGEETQIGGLPSLAGEVLVGLPGTHTKWALVRDGAIESFTTAMTGEVFAALRDHTILGRGMTRGPVPFAAAAFERGVRLAETSGVGALSTIFTTRALGLLGRLGADEASDYLSGLLIGHELIDVGDAARSASHAVVTGGQELVTRYVHAGAVLGLHLEAVPDAAPGGLARVARAAGIVEGVS